MLKEKIESIKKNVFVYHIIPFDSTGIYIAESKEDAFASIRICGMMLTGTDCRILPKKM